MKNLFTKLIFILFIISHSAVVYCQSIIWNERQPAGAANYNWTLASMSPDGMKIIAGVYLGRVYMSTNCGRSWNETQPAGNVNAGWSGSAISSDGTKIIVGAEPGRLYRSTDGGSTWVETTPTGSASDYDWITLSMSSDGSRIIAGSQHNYAAYKIYISTDYGSSWTETQPAGNTLQFWQSTSMSSDGTKIIAASASNSGKIHLSTDGGSSWTELQPAGAVGRSWESVSMSPDGTKIIAAVYNGRVYISTDSGTNWSETKPAGDKNGFWRSTSISSDGTKLFAGGDQTPSRLFFSTNSGANWSETQPAGNIDGRWLGTSISSDGSKAFAINKGGRVYYSTIYPGAGSGTSGDPFQVSSLACLSSICQNPGSWTKYFIQTTTIDASQTQYWDDADDNSDGTLFNDPNDLTSTGNNEGWSPIGNNTTKFTGNYNGQGYATSNLYINRGSTNYNGLFGYTSGGSINNLNLTAVSITGGAYTGGFVGLNSGTNMTKCSSTGTVSGAVYIGGFAGLMEINPTVDQCYSTVSVTSTGAGYCGGFTGSATNATISNSYATGSVTGGTSYRGGFVGNSATSTIDKCYSTGLVSGSSSVGGFIGINDDAGRPTVTNSFWDITTSGQGSSDGGTGKTTAQMKSQSTFTDAGWSTEIWNMGNEINDGYPYLDWQNPDGSPLPVELTSFTAIVVNNNVQLTWQTATEVNNYGFNIERCVKLNAGSDNWIKVGFVQGHGNSNSPKNYSFTDKSLKSGNYSYRLNQIDTDGKFEYSDVVEVTLNNETPDKFELSQNFPNPFNPSTTISYSIPKNVKSEMSKVKLIVYDILGNEVATLVNELKNAGFYEVSFDGSKLSSGTYFYTLQSGNFTETKKLLLLK